MWITSVPRGAHAEHLVRVLAEVASVAELAPAARPVWAHARTTVVAGTQLGVTVVTTQAPVRMEVRGEFSWFVLDWVGEVLGGVYCVLLVHTVCQTSIHTSLSSTARNNSHLGN